MNNKNLVNNTKNPKSAIDQNKAAEAAGDVAAIDHFKKYWDVILPMLVSAAVIGLLVALWSAERASAL